MVDPPLQASQHVMKQPNREVGLQISKEGERKVRGGAREEEEGVGGKTVKRVKSF